MYRLVIADDEKRIRQGLKTIVNWEQFGFRVSGVFADGQEVVEYLQYVVPDVILTDIKMSYVSGLEVARYVSEHKLPCKVVLVSGYQEFEFAVQAMKYGVEEYLLKPVEVAELEKIFGKIRKQLDKEQEEHRQKEILRTRVTEAIPLLEERFFSDLIMGAMDNDEYIRSCLKILYPQVIPEVCRCLVADIYIQDYEHFMNEIWEYSYDQLEINLTNFLRIYQEQYSFRIVYKADHLIEIIGIYVGDSSEQQCDTEKSADSACSEQQIIERLVSELQENFGFRATCFIRRSCKNIFEIKEIEKDERFLETEEKEEVLYQHLQEQKKLVMSNIILGNIVTAQKIFRNILEEVKVLSVVQRNNMVIEMLSMIHTVLGEINKKLAESLEPYFNYRVVLAMTKQEELIDYINRIFDRLKLDEGRKGYYDADSLVSRARLYIQENIYKDISQEETAGYLYISPSYLSRLFRKQTGETFLQYVTKVKMEKAIELLKDPQYKTYQVSDLLGYKTPRYFSRLFRNHTGMNPGDYRGKVLHIGNEES